MSGKIRATGIWIDWPNQELVIRHPAWSMQINLFATPLRGEQIPSRYCEKTHMEIINNGHDFTYKGVQYSITEIIATALS